jgi:hypothetical protein
VGRTALPEAALSNPLWEVVGTEPAARLDGIHLGRFRPQPGAAYQYRDAVTTPLLEHGFAVRVAQGSHGPVVLSAGALEGYLVEVAEADADHHLNWREKEPWRDTVVLAADGGNLPNVPPSLWNDANLGNPDTYWGIIRVTALESKTTRYYAVGADFVGEPDDWQVRGGVIEVAPTATALSPATPPTLPASG